MKSEVARILAQIELDYVSANNGLRGLSSGNARHSFITARMEHMTMLQQTLEEKIGRRAGKMIAHRLDQL